MTISLLGFTVVFNWTAAGNPEPNTKILAYGFNSPNKEIIPTEIYCHKHAWITWWNILGLQLSHRYLNKNIDEFTNEPSIFTSVIGQKINILHFITELKWTSKFYKLLKLSDKHNITKYQLDITYINIDANEIFHIEHILINEETSKLLEAYINNPTDEKKENFLKLMKNFIVEETNKTNDKLLREN